MKKETFYQTIVDSPQWKSWQKEQARRFDYHTKKHSKKYTGCWDMAECEEMGLISPGHWQDFVKFIKKIKEA